MTASLEDCAFLGRTVERLSNLIETQSATIFEEHGLTIPVKSCSLVTQLADLENATAAELARALNVSHQLVLQKLPKLLKLRLIRSAHDTDDARKKSFSLTASGKRQLEIFLECRDMIREVYIGLFEEVGNIFALTNDVIRALEAKPMSQRLRRR